MFYMEFDKHELKFLFILKHQKLTRQVLDWFHDSSKVIALC
jgi:hypothetical protein